MAASTGSTSSLLLFYLDQAFGRRGWHGPTLSGALRGVKLAEALWRPAKGRNSIWELVLHAGFWKNAVRRRLDPEHTEPFPRTPVDFPHVPAKPTARAWALDVELLKSEHARLVALVEWFPPNRFNERIPGKTYIPVEQIAGIAAHDLYHCGQVSLIRRLWAASRRR